MQLSKTTEQFSLLQNTFQIHPLLSISTAMPFGQATTTSHWPHSNSRLLVLLWFPAYQNNLFKKADQIRSFPWLKSSTFLMSSKASPVTQQKESCLQCRRCRFSPWVRRSPGGENGKPLQYAFLENPVDRWTWQAKNQRVTRVGHDWVPTHIHTHTHTHNGSPAPSAYRIKSKLLISIQPPPMFSTYYKPPLITVHLSSGLPSVPKHSSSLTSQACLFLISLFPNRPVPGQPIKNSLLTPGTNTNSVYLCLFFVCLSHQTVSSMKEEIKSIFPSSFT